jgi:integrase
MALLKLVPPKPPKYKYWYIRGTDPTTHRRIQTSTGVTSRREAELIFQKYQKDLLNGRLGQKAISFTEAAISYVESRQPSTTQREAIIGRERRDGKITACLVEALADIDDVRRIDQASVNELVRGRPGLKPGTVVRQIIQPLTAVLNHVAKDGYCDVPRFTRPRYHDERDRFATREECEQLLSKSAAHVQPLWLFLILNGCRIGEALNLQIPDVYLETQWCVFQDTKDEGRPRGVAIHRQLIPVLRSIIGQRTTGPVFLNDDGLPYRSRPKKAWEGVTTRAGIEDLHIHDLRHTFATYALVAGVPSRMIKEQMGHARAEDMHSRYVHVPRPDLIQATQSHSTASTNSPPLIGGRSPRVHAE